MLLKKEVIMVISGLLTWCVYESSKEACGKCSGGSNMPYFTLFNKKKISDDAAWTSAS